MCVSDPNYCSQRHTENKENLLGGMDRVCAYKCVFVQVRKGPFTIVNIYVFVQSVRRGEGVTRPAY